MNYFSHYFFDHIAGREEHNFGLSLPDFVRNYVKGKKLFPPDAKSEKSEFSDLMEGTQKHFSRDRVFHNSEYFKKTEHQLKLIIRPLFQSLDIGRYWFASHILSEMIIDRVLMKMQMPLLDLYYSDLQKADLGHILRYLNDNGIHDTSTFEDRIYRFTTSQYLRQYVNDPALIYSLNRIYIHVKAGNEWSKSQYETLQKAIPEMESIIFDSINDLIDEMK